MTNVKPRDSLRKDSRGGPVLPGNRVSPLASDAANRAERSIANGIYINGTTGYRDNTTSGVATGSNPEGMYIAASATHVNSGCCIDCDGSAAQKFGLSLPVRDEGARVSDLHALASSAR